MVAAAGHTGELQQVHSGEKQRSRRIIEKGQEHVPAEKWIMKRILMLTMPLFLLGNTLSGCVVSPWHDDEDRGRYHEGRHGDYRGDEHQGYGHDRDNDHHDADRYRDQGGGYRYNGGGYPEAPR
jgi:hypothetical protein